MTGRLSEQGGYALLLRQPPLQFAPPARPRLALLDAPSAWGHRDPRAHPLSPLTGWRSRELAHQNRRGSAALAVALGVIAALFTLGTIAPRRIRNKLAGVIFLGPALLFVTVGLVVPAVRTLILSFKGADDPSPNWVGWKNYSWIIHDPQIHIVLRNTLLWIAIAPIVATGAGLGLAVLIDKMKRESIPKSLIFAPMAVSFVGASIIWGVIYQHDQTGLLTALATTSAGRTRRSGCCGSPGTTSCSW